MKRLLTYFVADNLNELELKKTVAMMEKLGYEKIGDVIIKSVPDTNVKIYLQAFGQFKEE